MDQGVRISERTVGRWLARLDINHRRFLDPEGSATRRPSKRIVARYPGHMVHLDVKKVGRIPGGGGWRAHGRGSEQARTAQRAKTACAKGGYIYLHSAVDGFSRLAYTERLPDEEGRCHRGVPQPRPRGLRRPRHPPGCSRGHRQRRELLRRRLRTLLDFVGLSPPPDQALHGSAQRQGRALPNQRILAEELLYARQWTSEEERARAITVWNVHYNHHRPHTTAGNRPPASRLHANITNVMASNT